MRFNLHKLLILIINQLLSHDLNIKRIKYQKEVFDAILFATTVMKYRYDRTHKSFIIKLEEIIFLKLHHKYHLLEHNLLD